MRNKKKLILSISIGFVGLIAVCYFTFFRYIPIMGVNAPKFESYPDYTQNLTPEQMKEDLRQLMTDLEEVHPATIHGLPPDLEAAFADAEGKLSQEMTVREFSFLTAELVCLLKDAHTGVRLGIGERSLPMKTKVIDNKVYVLGGRNLSPGDELLSLGGVAAEDIFSLAKRLQPAENPYWLNECIPYMLTQSILSQMGAEIDDNRGIDAEVKRNGETQVIRLEPGYTYNRTEPNQEIEFYPSNSSEYGYYIDSENSICHFRLRSCLYDEDYIQFVKTMFQEIKNKRIENIIVDLRGNYGGNSTVAKEFLKYIDIDEYKSFGCIRRMSRAAAGQRGYLASRGTITRKPRVAKNQKVEALLFSGEIYALIDNGTFSSGNAFAVILADNGIGTIIGEPSGNAPNSYGDILSFQLKHSKLFYQVSYTQWMRPNEELADEDALYPHYPVPYTIDDYLNNKDLAMEEALQLIQGGKNGDP